MIGTANLQTEVPIYEEPDNFHASEHDNIDLKECPAYERIKKDADMELEQCPAYGRFQSGST